MVVGSKDEQSLINDIQTKNTAESQPGIDDDVDGVVEKKCLTLLFSLCRWDISSSKLIISEPS